MELIVTVGISGSGKSTWAADYIKANENVIRVNRDDIRMMITGSDSRLLPRHLENIVSKMHDEIVKTALDNGSNVILDNTHLQMKYINEIIIKYAHRAKISFRIFNEPQHVAKNRVMKRDNKKYIEEFEYIERQYRQFSNLVKNNKLGGMFKYEYKPDVVSPIDCIICDLDGTLSLYDEHKSPYNRDFENDTVNQVVLNIIQHYYYELDHKIFFFSGRNAKFRDQTMIFLTKYLDPDSFELIMREEKDSRRDSIVKQEMFMEHIHNRYNPVMAIDDRLQVIEEVWNKLGVFVLNVNQGNIRF